jgi:hypothetical protein
MISVWKSGLKTGKRPEKDWTKTGKDWTSSLGLSNFKSKTAKRPVYMDWSFCAP